MGNPQLLTINEARHYLRTRELPDNFVDRVFAFETYAICTNCDGVRDMNMVLRIYSDEPDWCPSCVEEEDDE